MNTEGTTPGYGPTDSPKSVEDTTGFLDASRAFEWLAEFIETNTGLEALYAELVARGIVIVVVIVLSFLANFFAKRILLRGLRALVSRSRTTWDDLLFEAKVFDRLAHIAPAVVIHSSAPLMFGADSTPELLTRRVTLAYMVLIGGLVLSALLDATVNVYRTLEISKARPIKSFAQVAKIFVFVIVSVLILGVLMEKSPWAFLSGLGAMTAVVLLVFKDSILGLVASIQLTSNNMVRLGDWVEMPKFKADGDVIDVSLTTIKVQNWDKTISTIPTYAFISDSFKNWRGMTESGGRRIKRSIFLDLHSVKFCDEPMMERFEKFELIKDYVKGKRKELVEFNSSRNVDTSQLINGRRMTNLGTFRRYVQAYIETHPDIHKGMTILVRHLQPTAEGIPIEIYAFSSDQRWASYEAIMADIFDHILAVVPEFDLLVFQNPAGQDLRAAVRMTDGLRSHGEDR